MTGINKLNGRVFFPLNHGPIGCFLKVILAFLSLYYPQVPEMLFDGRQLHPTQVDKPWKNASDNQTLERCICNGFFQRKRNRCGKV